MTSDGPCVGAVYFWDHEEEAEEGDSPTEGNLYFVADDLDDFLGRLR